MCVRLTPTLKPVYESSLSRHWTLWTLKNIYSYSIHLDSLECPKQCPVRAQCPIRCPKPLNVPQVRTFIIGVLHNGFWRSCRGAEVARFYGHSRLHVTRVHKRKGSTPEGADPRAFPFTMRQCANPTRSELIYTRPVSLRVTCM